MELHPSGFVETSVCTGPRYVREQPSRESSGVLLNEVTDKYVTEWGIPYTNMIAYTKELNNDWGKLDQNQKDVIANSLSLFVYKNPDALLFKPVEGTQELAKFVKEAQKEEFTDPTASFYKYISEDPKRVKEVLETLAKSKKVKEEMSLWISNEGYYKVDHGHILISIIVLIIILLIGVGIGYNC